MSLCQRARVRRQVLETRWQRQRTSLKDKAPNARPSNELGNSFQNIPEAKADLLISIKKKIKRVYVESGTVGTSCGMVSDLITRSINFQVGFRGPFRGRESAELLFTVCLRDTRHCSQGPPNTRQRFPGSC